MQISCYGETAAKSESAAEYRAKVDAKASQTVRTSDNILRYYNDAGGNTPLVAKTPPTFIDSASALFSKIYGILSLPNTPASLERKPIIAPSAPVPLAAFAAVGMLAFVIYKVGK